MRFLSRNVFARTDLVRETVQANGATCSWCGNVRTGARGITSLYRYLTQGDGRLAGNVIHAGLFCSKPCHDTYHS